MKNLIKIGLIAAVAWVAAGCCACRTYQKQTRRPLVGTEWHLIQLGGRNIRTEADRFTVRFAEDGKLSGVGSCNRLMGSYETKDDRALKIGPVATTMMLCPSDSELEQALGKALESTDHYDMDGPMLLLLADGELLAVFEAQPAAVESTEKKK